jgi:hypothetical protein
MYYPSNIHLIIIDPIHQFPATMPPNPQWRQRLAMSQFGAELLAVLANSETAQVVLDAVPCFT